MSDEIKRVDQALQVCNDQPLPVAQREQPSVALMLQAVIDKGVSSENVGALEKLVGLYERMQEKDAERQFAVAFGKLQSEMGGVKATRPVPNNDGGVRYKFAPFEDIMEQLKPHLKENGFAVSFSTDYADGRLVKLCTLQHVGGHSKTNKFAVRIGSGPPKATESQADGAASTYAKRFALCDALNIQIDTDTDASAEGGALEEKLAEELQRRVIETNSNEAAFLKFCGVTPSAQVNGKQPFADYARIPSTAYDRANGMLARKEAGGR